MAPEGIIGFGFPGVLSIVDCRRSTTKFLVCVGRVYGGDGGNGAMFTRGCELPGDCEGENSPVGPVAWESMV